MAQRTRSYDSLYTSAHLHDFQPTETLRDTMAKKDEDADLVVEIRITAESPTAARQTYNCSISGGQM